MPRNLDKGARDRARAARKEPSAAEALMWKQLRGGRQGFKFSREHPIDIYRLDFFCPEAMLNVEMDGEQHDPTRDAKRDLVLADLGILTFRVPNREFFGLDHPAFVNFIDEIREICEARTGRPALRKP
ncbi:MAG: DUF559 domain-containing protein [Fimbriimonadaceae bacterium]|nr:DUF559 domain-containing protein [Fimbriimonadaceae bacterium]